MKKKELAALKAELASTFNSCERQEEVAALVKKIAFQADPFRLSQVEITSSVTLSQNLIAALLQDLLGAVSCEFDDFLTARLGHSLTTLDETVSNEPLLFVGFYQIDFEQVCEILTKKYDLNGVSMETTATGAEFILSKQWQASVVENLPAVITPYHNLNSCFSY